jgi:predicted nucleotidyltransferase
MRLDPHQADRIRKEVHALFGPRARVWLFGSRVDDAARGGDIDLLVSVPEPLLHPARLASRLGARLQLALGEQRIDVVLEAPNLQPLPIHRLAHEHGVLL